VKRAEIYDALLLCAAVISLSVARADALPEDATLSATADDIDGHSWCRSPFSNETRHTLLEFHREWHSSGTYFGYTFTTAGNKQIRGSAGSWEIDENHILKRWGGGERHEFDFMIKMPRRPSIASARSCISTRVSAVIEPEVWHPENRGMRFTRSTNISVARAPGWSTMPLDTALACASGLR
jgi:hypothetical protein